MKVQASSITTNLTPGKIASYRALSASADPATKKAMHEMCDLLDSVNAGTPIKALSEKELEDLDDLLDLVQQDAANRNAEKLSAWRQQIRDRLFAEMLPGANIDDLLTRRRRLHYAVQNSINMLGRRVQPVIDAMIEELFPGKTEGDMQQLESKLVEWDNQSKALARNKEGRPELESTQLRDAAFQLYHYVKAVSAELNKK